MRISMRLNQIGISGLALAALNSGCDNPFYYASEPTACVQIDVVPQDSALPADGLSTTTVDLAACACAGTGEACDDSQLLDQVTLSLSITEGGGSLSADEVYLHAGRGTVQWTSPTADASSVATLTAENHTWSGTGNLTFEVTGQYPQDFTIAVDNQTLEANGSDSTIVTLTSAEIANGQKVTLTNTRGWRRI